MHLVKSPGSLLKIMGIEDTLAFPDKVLARRDQLLAGRQSSSGFGEPALGNALQKPLISPPMGDSSCQIEAVAHIDTFSGRTRTKWSIRRQSSGKEPMTASRSGSTSGSWPSVSHAFWIPRCRSLSKGWFHMLVKDGGSINPSTRRPLAQSASDT